MRIIGSWLLAAAAVLVSLIVAEQFDAVTYNWLWGVAGAGVGVLLVVTAGQTPTPAPARTHRRVARSSVAEREPVRVIGSWLLAAAAVLVSLIVVEQFIRVTYSWLWGVAGGGAGMLLVVTANAAGDARRVRLRNGRELPKAGIAARVGARLVDLLVVIPGVFIVLRSLYRAGVSRFPECSSSGFNWLCHPPGSVAEPLPWLTGAAIVAVVLVVLYEPVSVARWGRTAGKWAAGIKVVSIADGNRSSAARSFARVAVPMVAGLATLGVGWLVVQTVLYVSTMLNRDRRGWHDKMAATVVVKAKRRAARSGQHRGGDTVWGDPGDDTTNGGPGNDDLYGAAHDDQLHGNGGDDTLYG